MFHSNNLCEFLLLLVVGMACCSKILAATPDDLPIVQVRLAPPPHPLPQVSADVGALIQRREHFELDQIHQVQSAFEVSLDRAKAQIVKLINHTMFLPQHTHMLKSDLQSKARVSFLQTHNAEEKTATVDDGFRVKLSVVATAPLDASIKGMIEKIENKRSAAEKDMFQQACKEMEALTDVVLNELGAQIHANVMGLEHAIDMTALVSQSKPSSFMQTSDQRYTVASPGLAKQANVRVTASQEAFPRVSDLIQDMEVKRDSTEASMRAKILEMQLKLLQAENDMIKDALNFAVRQLLAI